jgi:hypothetical protein
MELPRNAADLDRKRGLLLAEISGIGQRYCRGTASGRPRDEALAAMYAVTRDPVLYGLALGAALSDLEQFPQWGSGLVELYRAAGPDEHVAAASLEWHRASRR